MQSESIQWRCQWNNHYWQSRDHILIGPLNQKMYYAYKCRILRGKGILRRPMFCANKRNMWSRCFNETLRHQKVLQLEKEILEKNALNQV